MRTGQTEVIIVVGIIIIAVVAVVFSLQQSIPSDPNVPSEIAQTQKAVKDSFISMARNGADDTIEIIENHGGYLNEDLLKHVNQKEAIGTQFLGGNVAYWQICQNDLSLSTKDVADQIAKGLEIFIKENIETLKMGFDKDVVFDTDNIKVDVIINDQRIDFNINLDTEIQGYKIQEPYTFTKPSNIKRIIEFSGDVTKEMVSNRHIEYFTIASMLYSKDMADGHPELPTSGFMIGCGDTIYRSPGEISNAVENIIGYTLGDILWWENAVYDAEDVKIYSIPSINGKIYNDFDPKIYLPDDFGIEFYSPIIFKNNKQIMSGYSLFTINRCVTFYDQRYSIKYPIIVKIEDELTGNDFYFSLLNYIDGNGEGMHPGNCDKDEIETETNICEDLGCYGRVNVNDSFGEPIEGASVAFGQCVLGKTDYTGVVEGGIMCGKQNLSVFYNNDYSTYLKEHNDEEVDGIEIGLNIKPNLKFTIYEIDNNCETKLVDNEMIYGFVKLDDGDQIPLINVDFDSFNLPENCETDPGACVDIYSEHLMTEIEESNIPAGKNELELWVMNPTKKSLISDLELPFIWIKDLEFTVPGENKDMVFYVPKSDGYFDDVIKCIGTTNSPIPGTECSPNIINCSTSCNDPIEYGLRISESYKYMTEEGLSPLSVPTQFKQTLEKCNKEVIQNV